MVRRGERKKRERKREREREREREKERERERIFHQTEQAHLRNDPLDQRDWRQILVMKGEREEKQRERERKREREDISPS